MSDPKRCAADLQVAHHGWVIATGGSQELRCHDAHDLDEVAGSVLPVPADGRPSERRNHEAAEGVAHSRQLAEVAGECGIAGPRQQSKP
jgi:hypothetical protein